MFKILEKLNIKSDSVPEKILIEYIDYFSEFNLKTNLVSKNDAKLLFEKHIYDSLAINLFFGKYINPSGITLSDLGTGGGFPSVPIAMFFPETSVIAADSVNKKINFINDLKEKFDLKNLTAICSRFEDLSDKYRESSDVIVSRAVAELNTLLEYALPFVKTGGYFVAYKSKKADDELKRAQNALKILKAELVDKTEYELPIEDDNTRVLLVFKKYGKTPPVYPRKNGIPKKTPL